MEDGEILAVPSLAITQGSAPAPSAAVGVGELNVNAGITSGNRAQSAMGGASVNPPRLPSAGSAISPFLTNPPWHSRPYVYVFVVVAPDLDAYRESGPRKRLRQFCEACVESKVETIIIYAPPWEPKTSSLSSSVVTSTSSSSSKRFWDSEDATTRAQRRVLEKLRAEVNAIKAKDRIVVVRTQQDFSSEFVPKLKECIREAVEVRLQAYEDEVHRVFSNRLLSDWSFHHFFLLKEGLSFLYVQLGRHDMALRCYDELAAHFSERDERENSFGAVFGDDGAIGVTNAAAKDFRALINAGSITELDFRTYLFARQLELLDAEQKYSEIADRGKRFIALITKRSAEESARQTTMISSTFRDAWCYSASTALISILEPNVLSGPLTDGALESAKDRNVARLVASLYVLAIKSFSELVAIHLPGSFSSLNCVTDQEQSTVVGQECRSPSDTGVSNPELRIFLESVPLAESQFSKLSSRGAVLYELGGRPRSACSLSGNAGRVHLRNGSLEKARTQLSRQSQIFNHDHGWLALQIKGREDLASCEKLLGMQHEYLVSCINLLALFRDSYCKPFVSDELIPKYQSQASRWAREVETVAKLLPPAGFRYGLNHLFDVYMMAHPTPWREGDEAHATIVIDSDLHCELSLDSATAVFLLRGQARNAGAVPALGPRSRSVGRASSKASSPSFEMKTVDPFKISYGFNQVKVKTADVPWAGSYDLSRINLVVGRLKLTWSSEKNGLSLAGSGLLESSASTSMMARLDRQVSFRATPRPESAIVQVEQTRQLFFVAEAWQYICVSITSGPLGICAGAEMEVELSLPSDTISAASVSLMSGSAARNYVNNGKLQDSWGDILSVNLVDDSVTCGRIAFSEAWKENERRCGLIAVAVSFVEPASLTPDSVHGDEFSSFDGLSCSIRCEFVGCEAKASNNREFECTVVENLRFLRPVSIGARLQTRGTNKALVCCSLQYPHMSSSVVVRDVNLSLPKWGVADPCACGGILPVELTPCSSLFLAIPIEFSPSWSPGEPDEALEDSTGILRVELTGQGILEEIVCEGMLDLDQLIRRKSRFSLTCTGPRFAELGRPYVIQYHLSILRDAFEEEPTSLLFSLESDDSAWMQLGRVRGDIIFESPSIDVCSTIIPLRTGRVLAPQFRILEIDGLHCEDEMIENDHVVWVKPAPSIFLASESC
uniref:TRAPPC10/Trs130 N-terminal domain-containing protein n=1 Tax=Compsopogon caeruleus TaxID=31354 RepID=A0A7S1THP0_9RHOD